ncbi:MAG: MotA/TolQ/ExbB proton channel family protein, partial [Verrucomicrobiota bacterium]
DGEQVTGTFLLLGPVSYFSSNEEVGMISMLATDRIRPKVIADIPGIEAVSSIIAGGEGRVPFDPTMNDALELQVNRVSPQQEIQAGGVFIWPIIGFAALAILIAIFKFFEIYSVKIPSENTIEEIVQLVNEGQRAEALKQARAIPGPFGRLMLDAVEHADERKELIEEVLYERMLETRPQLERMLAFIAVTAATSPLLGLLGTVTGMIKTFQQITLFGTSDASKLAGGISEALITTKWGLIAAIPALILHALLSRKAQGVLAGMEKFSATFINGLQQKAGKKS